MKRFRNAVIAVIGGFLATYGLLVFMEYRLLAAHQLPQDHPKFPPEAAWIFAGLHTTLIFVMLAVVGVAIAVLWSIFEYFRSRRQKLRSTVP
jgi:phosphatidylglycerophosphate synthase